MAKAPIQIVVFDIGGVLVRICRSWQQVFDMTGLPWQPAFEHEQAVNLNTQYETGRITTRQLAEHLGEIAPDLTGEQIMALIDQWLIEPYAGTVDLVNQLKSAGVATACLSNTNDRHWQRMAVEPPFTAIRALDTRIASHLVHSMKPDSGIYEALENETGVDPKAIIFFDDFEHNVAAARERGWQAHQIDHAGDTAAQMAGFLAKVI